MNQQPEMGSIIFGGMAITGLAWGGADLDESKAAIHAALDHGITTFDTAPFYGFGLSEELIGRAIAGQRDRVYIATKIGLRWDGTPGKHHMDVTFGDREYVVNRHAKPDSIVWEVEQSLKRLDTDWIDSLQYHHHDPDTPLEESLSAMQRLVEQGKAILMISSELSEVLGMADRIIVLHEGRVKGEINDVKTATQESIMSLAVK